MKRYIVRVEADIGGVTFHNWYWGSDWGSHSRASNPPTPRPLFGNVTRVTIISSCCICISPPPPFPQGGNAQPTMRAASELSSSCEFVDRRSSWCRKLCSWVRANNARSCFWALLCAEDSRWGRRRSSIRNRVGRSAKCTADQTSNSDLVTVDFCNFLGERSQEEAHMDWIKGDKAESAGNIGG